MEERNIPTGWKKVKLKEVLKEVNERNKDEKIKRVLSVTNSLGFVEQKEYFERNIHSTNTSNYKIINRNQFAYNPSRVNVGSIDLLKKYDVGILSPMYVVFEVDTTKLLPDYFKYYFQTNRFYENVKNNTQGSVRNSLSFKALADFDYLLPSIEEQEKIVKILKNIDFIIEKYANLLEEKNQFIKSQFINMFGNPVKSNKYGRVTLDRLTKVRQGLQMPISERKSTPGTNRYKYITIQYLHNNKEIEYIENPNPNVICNKEDILMTRTGNTGKIITGVDGVFHNNFFIIDFDKDKLCSRFFIEFFKNKNVYREILIRATSTSILDLSHSEFYKISIDLPPLEMQNEFSKIANLIDKQKFLLNKQKQNYEKLKKALMQKLLTGKVRVKK